MFEPKNNDDIHELMKQANEIFDSDLNTSPFVWTGITMKNSNDSFTYLSNGKSLNFVMDWDKNQPSCKSFCHCAILYTKSDSLGKWYDSQCIRNDSKFQSICQRRVWKDISLLIVYQSIPFMQIK